ncbi:MAG: calycin-like domain-containing protein [Muribaculaceae bacterium]|nr:calycin-like domain-containing protein [Muribaculaceae bacterium]
MRKTFTTLSLAALLVLPLSGQAQQLPNNGFAQWKESCGSTLALSKKSLFNSTIVSEERVRPGIEPMEWNGSSVNQKVGFEVQKELISKVSDGDVDVLQMQNVFVGFGTIGSVAPGYVNLGTPWVYAETSVSNCDGGSFGGLDFTYRPDAVQGTFKRTDTNEEKSHLIFYSWKGTFTSKIGTADGKYVIDQTDVDRAILGKVEASQKGTLIGSVDYEFDGSDWQTITAPITYVSSEIPEKVNVIACSGNYWDRTALVEGTTLLCKDIKLIYHSRLKDLQVNGATIDGFASDKYDYTVDAELPEEDAFSFATLGNSGVAQASIALDKENAKTTITVANAHGSDIDDAASHVYTVQFRKASEATEPTEGDKYTGDLDIWLGGDNMTSEEKIPANVYVNYVDDNTCTVSLPGFTLDGEHMADIIVPNVKVSHDGEKVCFEGEANDLTLDLGLGAPISASASLSASDCYIDANGTAYFKIVVTWHTGSDMGDMPIDVIFNGNGPKPAGINGLDVDNSNAPVEYYNIQGIRVSGDMAPGIYIRRQGTEVKKVLVK